MPDLHQVETLLLARRAELTAELDRLTAPREPGSAISFGKRIGDGTTEAVERIATTATAHSIAGSIKDLDRAIAKIEDGTYGYCDRCGDPIPAARLEAMPASAHCVTCRAVLGR